MGGRRTPPRTTLLTVLLYAFAAGIWCGRYSLDITSLYLAPLAVLPGLTFHRRTASWLILAAALGWLLGLGRGALAWREYKLYDEYFGTKVELVARAAEDAVYDDKAQLAFMAELVRVTNNGEPVALPGRVQIGGMGAVAVYRGDEVRATGKLRPSRGSKVAQMSFATVEVLGRPDDKVQALRQSFAAGMQTAIPEPMASFGMGVLIGQRSTLPREVNDELSAAGLTHLVAVSGYNLTILVQAARKLFAKQSHFQSMVLAAFLIVGFLLCTGFSASIVRAAIVSGLSLLAGYYGRSIRPLLLIALAAVITGAANPLYIWFDIGWYLSFTAFFGVVVVAPLLTKRLFGVREPKMIVAVCIESAAAQIATLPVILMIFGRLSVYGLAANVLAVPFVPLAMLLACIAGIGGVVSPLLGGLAGWPARLLLRYILDIAAIFARLPHSLAEFYITPAELGLCYALLIGVCIVMNRSVRRRTAVP